jgi:hypothetical protein
LHRPCGLWCQFGRAGMPDCCRGSRPS